MIQTVFTIFCQFRGNNDDESESSLKATLSVASSTILARHWLNLIKKLHKNFCSWTPAVLTHCPLARLAALGKDQVCLKDMLTCHDVRSPLSKCEPALNYSKPHPLALKADEARQSCYCWCNPELCGAAGRPLKPVSFDISSAKLISVSATESAVGGGGSTDTRGELQSWNKDFFPALLLDLCPNLQPVPVRLLVIYQRQNRSGHASRSARAKLPHTHILWSDGASVHGQHPWQISCQTASHSTY